MNSFVNEDVTAIKREIETVKRQLVSHTYDEEDKPRLKAKLDALEKALKLSTPRDEACEGRGRRGDALDSERTEAARVKLAMLKEGRIEELQSAVDYLYSRAVRDPSDPEARSLAIKALLQHKEPMRSSKINRLLAPMESGISHLVSHADTETAFETLKQHGFTGPLSGAPQGAAIKGQHLDRVLPKMKAFEKPSWVQVIDLVRDEDRGGDDTDTSAGFSGGPERHRFTLFRTDSGHIARLISMDLIGGEPYVSSLYYLEHAGF